MKKLVNEPGAVVREFLEGLTLARPGLTLLDGHTVVVRADVEAVRATRVAVVSGGGSGHEPAHAGFVGPGMLTAAVAGDVFTSPAVDAVLDTIRTVAGAPGVLLVVKSYTGDRLNFGLAAELAGAEGIDVEMVVVGDDVALTAGGGHAGRRGLAGTVLVHKVAGAAAAAGLPLEEVAEQARAAAAAVATMGVALTPGTVPAAGRPGFELGPDEVELGLGIHGEPGVRRVPVTGADELTRVMLERITAEAGLGPGERVVLLVNGLGGTPAMELGIVTRAAVRELARAGLVTERVWCGSFLTSLEMAGCSLTLMRVDDAMLARLDAPAAAPAWVAAPPAAAGPAPAVTVRAPAADRATTTGTVTTPSGRAGATAELAGAVRAVCDALIAAEPRLTDMDRTVGDGDLGTGLARGARAVLESLPDAPDADTANTAGAPDSPDALLRDVAGTVRRAVGGTSGPLYSVFLLRAAGALGPRPEPADWVRALEAGTRAVAELGGASPGDRTMVDALVPAAEALARAVRADAGAAAALRRAADAAAEAAAATASMVPRLGRASYLGERALGTPDPGAEAVAVWLAALAEHAAGR